MPFLVTLELTPPERAGRAPRIVTRPARADHELIQQIRLRPHAQRALSSGSLARHGPTIARQAS